MTATFAALRKSRRVSQLELSLRAGVSQRHLSCIETGRSRAATGRRAARCSKPVLTWPRAEAAWPRDP